MPDIPEICPEAQNVAEEAATSGYRRRLTDGFAPGELPGVSLAEDVFRIDFSADPAPMERYVSNPVYRDIIDGMAEKFSEEVLDVLRSKNEVVVDNEFGIFGTPPLAGFDWEEAADVCADRLPRLPGQEAVEWRLSYRDGLHPTTWRLVHVPTGWRSGTASRWERTEAGCYRSLRGDFAYEITPIDGQSPPARVEPDGYPAVKEMAGVSTVEYSGDATHDVRPIDAYTHPEAEPSVQEIQQAFLDGEITASELETALENCSDLLDVGADESVEESPPDGLGERLLR